MTTFEIPQDVEQENNDRVGVKRLLPTGAYPMLVKLAYYSFTKGGAKALNLTLQPVDSELGEVRQTLYVASGDAKGNLTYYVNKKTGKKHLPPDMHTDNQLAQVTLGKSITEVPTAQKTVKIYDYDTKKEEPVEVPVLVEMLNTQFVAGIISVAENKRALNPASGAYEPTNEIREFNEVEKLFNKDNFSVQEMRDKVETPVFLEEWKGLRPPEYVNSDVKEVANAPRTSTNTAPPSNDLFS